MCSPTWRIVWHVSFHSSRELKGRDLVSKLVSVLAWRRNPHCARPVVIHVGQFVADLDENELHWVYQCSSPSGWCRAWGQCCRELRCSGWATLCPGRRAATPRRSRTSPSSSPARSAIAMRRGQIRIVPLTVWSRTVPGDGFSGTFPPSWKILVLILFCTTTNLTKLRENYRCLENKTIFL